MLDQLLGEQPSGCNDPTVWTLTSDGKVVNLGPVWRDLSKN